MKETNYVTLYTCSYYGSSGNSLIGNNDYCDHIVATINLGLVVQWYTVDSQSVASMED